MLVYQVKQQWHSVSLAAPDLDVNQFHVVPPQFYINADISVQVFNVIGFVFVLFVFGLSPWGPKCHFGYKPSCRICRFPDKLRTVTTFSVLCWSGAYLSTWLWLFPKSHSTINLKVTGFQPLMPSRSSGSTLSWHKMEQNSILLCPISHSLNNGAKNVLQKTHSQNEADFSLWLYLDLSWILISIMSLYIPFAEISISKLYPSLPQQKASCFFSPGMLYKPSPMEPYTGVTSCCQDWGLEVYLCFEEGLIMKKNHLFVLAY